MSYTELQAADKTWLLALARNAIKHSIQTSGYLEQVHPVSPAVEQMLACFVTLRIEGELRGCIGHLEPIMPLHKAIIENAIAAATKDYRFNPVSMKEIGLVKIDISVLSPQQHLIVETPSQLLQQIIPGRDGLVIQYLNHKATFLPSVWKQLPTPELFLQNLLQKAGLMKDFWHPSIQCYSYQTTSFSESVDF